jgi:hypothetical protein
MSYPRNMAGAVALLASSSLLGLGCMVAAGEPDEDTDEQSIVAGEVGPLDTAGQSEGSAGAVGSGDETESTGESKDALWYGGFGRFGRFGYGGFGRFGYGGFGRFGYPLHGYGSLYGFGYPFYGYGGFGYPFYGYGGCGYGC